MNQTTHKPTAESMVCMEREQNLKVLEGLKNLFAMLTEHGAVIGRNRARIVIDMDKAPSLIEGELSVIFSSSCLIGTNEFLRIFDSFHLDEENGVLILNISDPLQGGGDSVFAKLHAFAEVRYLFDGIALLPEVKSKFFDALNKKMEDHFIEIMSANREAVIEAVFGGEDADVSSQTYPDDGKTLN